MCGRSRLVYIYEHHHVVVVDFQKCPISSKLRHRLSVAGVLVGESCDVREPGLSVNTSVSVQQGGLSPDRLIGLSMLLLRLLSSAPSTWAPTFNLLLGINRPQSTIAVKMECLMMSLFLSSWLQRASIITQAARLM